MEIEFECGTVKKNIGNLVLALQAHIKECSNDKCKQDCEKNIQKYK
jgi:hypothetical protein